MENLNAQGIFISGSSADKLNVLLVNLLKFKDQQHLESSIYLDLDAFELKGKADFCALLTQWVLDDYIKPSESLSLRRSIILVSPENAIDMQEQLQNCMLMYQAERLYFIGLSQFSNLSLTVNHWWLPMIESEDEGNLDEDLSSTLLKSYGLKPYFLLYLNILNSRQMMLGYKKLLLSGLNSYAYRANGVKMINPLNYSLGDLLGRFPRL